MAKPFYYLWQSYGEDACALEAEKQHLTALGFRVVVFRETGQATATQFLQEKLADSASLFESLFREGRPW